MNITFEQLKNTTDYLDKDSYVTTEEAIQTIAEKLNRPYFNIDSLVLLTRTGKLDIYAGVSRIISYIVPSDDPEAVNEPIDLDAVSPYVVKAAKWYDISKPIPTGFNYHDNGIIAGLHAFNEDESQWLINIKELQAYLDQKKTQIIKKNKVENTGIVLEVEPDWDTLEKGLTANRGKLLVYAWRQLWLSGERHFPSALELIEWLVDTEDSHISYYEIEKDLEGLLIKSSHGNKIQKKLWVSDNIEDSRNKIIKRYEEQVVK